MESKDIIVITLVIAALGFSLYRKHLKKNQTGSQTKDKGESVSSFSSGNDDDYEPYSKK
jgi:hypothetical protein